VQGLRFSSSVAEHSHFLDCDNSTTGRVVLIVLNDNGAFILKREAVQELHLPDNEDEGTMTVNHTPNVTSQKT
jgi:predicted peptidase